MSDDILKLPVKNKREGKEDLFLVKPPYDNCLHFDGPFEVDRDSERCKCLRCGKDVSPMFVLERLMNQESRWQQTRKNYQDEMRRLRERSSTKCQHCQKITRISHR